MARTGLTDMENISLLRHLYQKSELKKEKVGVDVTLNLIRLRDRLM